MVTRFMKDLGRDPMINNFSYEKLCAISHHVTEDLPGVGGRIKELISDFIVQEINKEREVIKVSDIPVKKENNPGPNGRKFTSFVLKKFGIDTIHAVELLADATGISRDLFKFSGIKDNKAITSQWVTIDGDHFAKLVEMADHFPNLQLRMIGYSSMPIRTGGHWGNNFMIRIRNIDLEIDECLARVQSVINALDERGGFLNYFGLQRFGTHRPNSQWMGKKIVLGDWEGAFNELIVPVYPAETRAAARARRLYGETGDAARTLELMPESMLYERIALKHLANHPGDYKGAMLALPPSLFSLYVYSYQSYLFNKAISYRFEASRDPLDVQPGDLVALLDVKYGQMTRTMYKVNEKNIDVLKDYLKLGKACIAIPIIGNKVQPDEDSPMKPIYDRLMDEEGIDIETFSEEGRDVELNLGGVYRPYVLHPRNFNILEVSSDDLHKGKTACRLAFDLPKGTYATMLIREFMKVDDKLL